jgi:hypothetical protein
VQLLIQTIVLVVLHQLMDVAQVVVQKINAFLIVILVMVTHVNGIKIIDVFQKLVANALDHGLTVTITL